MAWRHHPPEVESHVRQQIRRNPHDVVRLMASMGMALYAPTRDNVDNLVAAFTGERNSVVRALMQRIANQWLGRSMRRSGEQALRSVVDSRIDLRTEDAERATLQRMNYSKPEQVLLAFRRAMVQGDRLWPAAVGAILVLGVVRHSRRSRTSRRSRRRHDIRRYVPRTRSCNLYRMPGCRRSHRRDPADIAASECWSGVA